MRTRGPSGGKKITDFGVGISEFNSPFCNLQTAIGRFDLTEMSD